MPLILTLSTVTFIGWLIAVEVCPLLQKDEVVSLNSRYT